MKQTNVNISQGSSGLWKFENSHIRQSREVWIMKDMTQIVICILINYSRKETGNLRENDAESK